MRRAGSASGIASRDDEHRQDEPGHAHRHERDPPAVDALELSAEQKPSTPPSAMPEERMPSATARPRAREIVGHERGGRGADAASPTPTSARQVNSCPKLLARPLRKVNALQTVTPPAMTRGASGDR